MTAWQNYLSENARRYLEELVSFLRIPSISSLPEHKNDVARAAGWVANRLQAAGLEGVIVMETEGHPVVCGQWLHAGERPTVLIYGHFDVQPVDPVELWTHPPFEPTVRDGRIYARGASDDKGNMLAPILAVEALLETSGRLPVNLKVFFEGQEEIGSPDLPNFIRDHRELLACDMIFSADGGQLGEDQPAVVVGRRGLCALQVDVKGASGDLHSGTYGGAILNPIQALAHLLASLHHSDGRVAVDGFYDEVRELGAGEKASFKVVPFGEAELISELKVPAAFGEPGYSICERLWARPTLEFNGIWGGFQGEGSKTVIPSEAHAKISCRLVPDQDPEKVLSQVMDHLKKHAPAEVSVTTRQSAGHADPVSTPVDHPGNRAAAAVLEKLYGKKPLVVGMGGTIPVCGLFYRHLKANTVNFAFGLKDENIHAPDEFFRMSSFERARTAWAMLLESL